MRAFNKSKIPRPDLATEVLSALAKPDVDLEIGAGQGLHAVRYCRRNPERTLLAIERTHERFAKLQARRFRHPDLKGLIPVHADAVSIISHFVRDEQLRNVFILYPNPYLKSRQANQRWYNRPFTALLCQRMRPGAQLTLATNIERYALEARDLIPARWPLRLESFSTVEPLAEPRTHFEKKYLERGETCWNLVFRKYSSD